MTAQEERKMLRRRVSENLLKTPAETNSINLFEPLEGKSDFGFFRTKKEEHTIYAKYTGQLTANFKL